jgi:hypothetical protein
MGDDATTLSVYTHRENRSSLTPGCGCLVRWDSNGRKLWYFCHIIELKSAGCVVTHMGSNYDISWEFDEVLAKPEHSAVQYVTMYPEAVCIEVGSTKYLVPHGELSLGDTIERINTLRHVHKEQQAFTTKKWKNVTIDAVASTTHIQKIVFAV